MRSPPCREYSPPHVLHFSVFESFRPNAGLTAVGDPVVEDLLLSREWVHFVKTFGGCKLKVLKSWR